MKNVWFTIAAVTAGIILLVNVGPLISLALCCVILYWSFRKFVKAEGAGWKIIWAAVGLTALTAALSHLPALLGIAAAYVLYVIYRNWKETGESAKADPFSSFEEEWNKLN